MTMIMIVGEVKQKILSMVGIEPGFLALRSGRLSDCAIPALLKQLEFGEGCPDMQY